MIGLIHYAMIGLVWEKFSVSDISFLRTLMKNVTKWINAISTDSKRAMTTMKISWRFPFDPATNGYKFSPVRWAMKFRNKNNHSKAKAGKTSIILISMSDTEHEIKIMIRVLKFSWIWCEVTSSLKINTCKIIKFRLTRTEKSMVIWEIWFFIILKYEYLSFNSPSEVSKSLYIESNQMVIIK